MLPRPRTLGACLLVAAGATATSLASSAAAHDTTGQSTLEQTLIGEDQQRVGDQPDGAFDFLRLGEGEPYVVRKDLANPKAGRKSRRRSLAYLGQITDFQLADEESPARVEFFDSEPSGTASSAQRPQEAFVTQQVEYTIRQMNRFVRSPVREGDGDRARMLNTVMTGDLADNQQRNETEWVVQLLEGGVFQNGQRTSRKLDPSSGTTATCPGAPSALIRDGDDPRKYTGVQDYGDYPGGVGDTSFYDANEPAGDYADWPRYQGLLDRAQKPFRVTGLKAPSYVAFGNHDALVQGNEDANAGFEDVATGCVKPFPTPGVNFPAGPGPGDAFSEDGLPPFEDLLLNPITPTNLVPPDERRQFVDKRQFKQLHATGKQEDEHGFGFIDSDERQESNGAASYYDFSPKRGIRYIVLDTVSDAGVTPVSSDGNLDDPQFEWLKDELDKATERNELVVVFGHHATGSLEANVPDEVAPSCAANDEHGHDTNPGCDRDPRSSSPVHLGEDLEALFHEFPQVVAYVAGHSHENRIQPLKDPNGSGGLWEIKSPAVVDWPPQHRLIEVMDNRDGTLSIFGTMLNHDGASKAPESTDASGFDAATLASVGRTLSYNDPQQGPDGSDGVRNDRNVELLLRDPRSGGGGNGGDGDGGDGRDNGGDGGGGGRDRDRNRGFSHRHR